MPSIVLLSGFETFGDFQDPVACTGSQRWPRTHHRPSFTALILTGRTHSDPRASVHFSSWGPLSFLADTCPETLAPPPLRPQQLPAPLNSPYPYICETCHKCLWLLNFCGLSRQVGCQPFGGRITTSQLVLPPSSTTRNLCSAEERRSRVLSKR